MKEKIRGCKHPTEFVGEKNKVWTALGNPSRHKREATVDLRSIQKIDRQKIWRRSGDGKTAANLRLLVGFRGRFWETGGLVFGRAMLSLTSDLSLDLGLRHERDGKRLFIERGKGEFLFLS